MVETVDSLIKESAERYGLDTKAFEALIISESGKRNVADSFTGRHVGFGQLSPELGVQYGIDRWNPKENIDVSARYLKSLVEKYGSLEKAIYHYKGLSEASSPQRASVLMGRYYEALASLSGDDDEIKTLTDKLAREALGKFNPASKDDVNAPFQAKGLIENLTDFLNFLKRVFTPEFVSLLLVALALSFLAFKRLSDGN